MGYMHPLCLTELVAGVPEEPSPPSPLACLVFESHFHKLSANERILKIGIKLTELEANNTSANGRFNAMKQQAFGANYPISRFTQRATGYLKWEKYSGTLLRISYLY